MIASPSIPIRAQQFSTRGAFFVAGLALSSLAPIIPGIKLRLSLTEANLGLFLLCVGLGSVLVMPFSGGLAARHGCRTVITIAILILCSALPCLAFANSIPLLATTMFIFGASAGTLDVVMNIQAVAVEKASDRPMMSGFHGMFSVGGIFGAGGISLLIALGVSAEWSLLIAAGCAFLLLALFAKHLLLNGGDSNAPAFAFPKGKVLLFGILCFILFMAEGSVLDWGGVFLSSVQKVQPGQAGLGYVAFAAMMTVNRLFGDPVVLLLGPRKIVLFGSLCGALGFVIAVLSPSWILSLVGFAFVGIGLSNVVPVMFSAAGRDGGMPTNLALASVTTMGYAGILVGPPVIGFVAGHSSLVVSFFLIAALLIGVAANAKAMPSHE